MKQTGKSQTGSVYLEKERQMVQYLVKHDGAPFDSKEEGLSFIEERLNTFPAYVNTVIHQQIQQPMIYANYRGPDLEDKIVSLDRSRHNAHDKAIDAINILNRFCAGIGLPPFADVDTTNRTAVADFAGRYVNEVFNNAIGGTMDEITKDAERSYDTAKTAERLAAAEQIAPGEGPDDEEQVEI